MLKITMILSLMLFASVVQAVVPDVVIAAGTKLSATNNAVIDSAAMKAGDDVNFTLSADVEGASGKIPKGSVVYGRVLEVQKFDAASGSSKLVVMFDFLQVGDDFHSLSAIIVSGAPTGVAMAKSQVFEDATLFSLKGGDIKIAEGAAFVINVEKNIEK